jgi:hypothetical protein
MFSKIKTAVAAVAATVLLLLSTGCTSAADTANENLTKAAENFEVPRRIIGINGITDKVLFSVEGFCSYEIIDGAYEVICLTDRASGAVTRTRMARSDNVTMVVVQTGDKNVSLFRPRVIFRPETIVPNFDLATSAG